MADGNLILDRYKHKRINHSKEFRDKKDKKITLMV